MHVLKNWNNDTFILIAVSSVKAELRTQLVNVWYIALEIKLGKKVG